MANDPFCDSAPRAARRTSFPSTTSLKSPRFVSSGFKAPRLSYLATLSVHLREKPPTRHSSHDQNLRCPDALPTLGESRGSWQVLALLVSRDRIDPISRGRRHARSSAEYRASSGNGILRTLARSKNHPAKIKRSRFDYSSFYGKTGIEEPAGLC
jgi:hypothetical protein